MSSFKESVGLYDQPIKPNPELAENLKQRLDAAEVAKLDGEIMRLALKVFPDREPECAIQYEYYDGRYRIREKDEQIPLITIARPGCGDGMLVARKALKAALEVLAGEK